MNAHNWLDTCLHWLRSRLHSLGLGHDAPLAMGPGVGYRFRYGVVYVRGRAVPIIGEKGLVSVHELKSWPQFFEAIIDGSKTFELRRDDRGGFAVDDILRLREYDPITQTYSGRIQCVRVTYVLDSERHCALSPKALHPDFCILGISMYWKNKIKVIEGQEWVSGWNQT